jgi:LacI family gluconate utilization system Gnt-I transcriptional repressor
MEKRRLITLREVAGRAGVSEMTASRALRGLAVVTPATRTAVEQAAVELGYVPNLLAGTLSTRRASGLVGAIVGTLSDATFALTLQGLGDVLGPAALQLVVTESEFEADREFQQARALVGRRVDGLVLAAGVHAPGLRQLLGGSPPTVEVWDLPRRPLDMVVGFSNETAGRVAADHLLARGRRRLAFAGSDFHRDVARWRGFAGAVAAAGAGPPERLRLGKRKTAFYDALLEGERLISSIAKGTVPFDGLFVCDDTAAIAAVAAAQRAGIKVPEHLAIVGFGNQRLCAHIEPRLTTVCVRAREIGAIAAQMITNPANWRSRRVVDLGARVEARDT